MSHPKGPSVSRGRRLMTPTSSLGVKPDCKMDSEMLAQDLTQSGGKKLIPGRFNSLSLLFHQSEPFACAS